MIATVKYRLGQFFHALGASTPEGAELDWVRGLLSPEGMALFSQMHPAEQQHSLRVAAILRGQGAPPELLIAALLHDVGKIRFPLRLWERVLIVLVRALFPGKAKQWGQGEPRGWRRPFVVAEQHPAWGAEMAQAAGAPPLAVNLIRRHQDVMPEEARVLEDRLLRMLQAVDNAS